MSARQWQVRILLVILLLLFILAGIVDANTDPRFLS